MEENNRLSLLAKIAPAIYQVLLKRQYEEIDNGERSHLDSPASIAEDAVLYAEALEAAINKATT